MLRRLLPLLLTFSLLISQLATQSHVYSHWSSVKDLPVATQSAAGDPAVSDVLCQLCLVGGQLASAINGSVHRLHVAATPAFFLSFELYQRLDRITTVVFRSRAPPAL